MGKLTALQIRNLTEPGRYMDGDGLSLVLTGPMKGYWVLRAMVRGRRRDIGLGSVNLVTLREARDAAFEMRRSSKRESRVRRVPCIALRTTAMAPAKSI